MDSAKQYAEILHELLEQTKEDNLDEVIKVFANLLKKNNDLKFADKIIENFLSYKEKEIYIESAFPLSDNAKKEFKKFGEIKEKINKSLIGGIKIRIDDTLIDGSVNGKLENLKMAMNR